MYSALHSVEPPYVVLYPRIRSGMTQNDTGTLVLERLFLVHTEKAHNGFHLNKKGNVCQERDYKVESIGEGVISVTCSGATTLTPTNLRH